MSVGLRCSVIVTQWALNRENDLNSKAFAENQRISECFVEASLQALTSQL